MSKRFTETSKWADPWFRALPPLAKVFFMYAVDNCDPAGVWMEDYGLASFCIGAEVNHEKASAWLSGRVAFFGEDKMLILGFVRFQYGTISLDCKMHKPVFSSLSRHGLSFSNITGFDTLSIPYRYPLKNENPKGSVPYRTEQNNTEQDKTDQDGKGAQRENQIPPANTGFDFQTRQAANQRAKAVIDLYPSRAKAGGRLIDKTTAAQNILASRIIRFPDWPWEDAARMACGIDYPLNADNWAQSMPDDVWLENLRKAAQTTTATTGGRKKLKELL
jgi:hypothetical protein